MGFMQLNKPHLLEVARYFSVAVDPESSKQGICAAFAAAEPPVTWDMYNKSFPSLDDNTTVITTESTDTGAAEKFKETNEPVLVKMERGNQRYEIRGYKFTREHPFLLVEKGDAEAILGTFGFRVATTEEVKNYYS
jgi:hypothetical protein